MAIQIDRNSPGGYYGRGLLQARAGDQDGAIANFNQAIKLYPKYADAYTGRSRSWAAKGNQKRAKADRKKALSLGETDHPYTANSLLKYAPKSGRSFSTLPSPSSKMPALKR